MDIFKLLSRSSNLQKPGHATANVSKQVVPSTGLPVRRDTQSIKGANIQTSDEKPELRGTKRKLSKNGNFKLDNQKELHAEANGEHDPFDAGASKEIRTDGDFDDANTKSAEDRRQTLNLNKLKILVLDDGRPAKVNVSSEIPKSGKQKESQSRIYPEPLTSFKQLRTHYKISKRLGENLDAQGYQYPTEVQVGSLPMLLGSDEERGLPLHEPGQIKKPKCQSPHLDLLTVAPTGSGKTLAFMVNVIHRLVEGKQSIRNMNVARSVDHQVQALILAPTHELADQIVNEGRKLAHGTGLKVSAMKKGMALDIDSSTIQLQRAEKTGSEDQEVSTNEEPLKFRPVVKADILVSTPMLLVNSISRNRWRPSTPLYSVRYLVLDEADVLLDPLFRDQTLGIWNACVHPSLQTSLWSATISSSIESLAQSVILDRRSKLGISSPHYLVRVVVGLKDSAVPNITHRLVYAATEQGKLLALRQLLHPMASSEDKGPSLRPPFLVFTQTIQRAAALHSELLYDIPPEAGGSDRIAVLHSDCSDSVRSAIMAGFRKGEIWVLITTDLLSRGIDFRGMNGVVNYDIPTTGASYVHRVGRTGRQGREGGVAVTLYTKEDIAYVKNIANVIAAGERTRGKHGDKSKGNEGTQNWLLNALPRVSKKTKRELKQRGVESRRAPVDGTREKEKRRARISTKSGYDRKLEHKRNGAAQGARFRKPPSASESEWGGIES